MEMEMVNFFFLPSFSFFQSKTKREGKKRKEKKRQSKTFFKFFLEGVLHSLYPLAPIRYN